MVAMNLIRTMSSMFCLVGLALSPVDRAALAAEGKSPPTVASPAQPSAAAEAVDTRTALRLTAMMAEHQKSNMRDHLAAVHEIVAAIAANDMPAVERATLRIGHSDAMAQMCQHMGSATPGFTEKALGFHRTAGTITAAAQRGDRTGVNSALAATLRTCVECHAAYRQEVVDEPTWRRLSTAGH